LSGFGSGDVIDVQKIVATTLSFLSGTLTLENGGSAVDTLFFSGNLTQSDFSLSSDGQGGTDVLFSGGKMEPPGVAALLTGPQYGSSFEPLSFGHFMAWRL